MRERFYVQPGEWVDASEPIVPSTMGDLVEVLGVADAPEDVRAAAIREWLKTNEPSQLLELYLVDEGFLDHVTDRV